MVRSSKVHTQTEKMKLLYGAKAEDVEFSAAEADLDDIEAQERGLKADKRQLQELLQDEEEEIP
ncbi:YfhD family protein [Paenibacillus sp. sgz500958]|uniref:YfhD family protein n=1 Tax=Paenibacillus sp. sgz500958 TaxID=3242475 RepID=UPI0036D3DDE0